MAMHGRAPLADDAMTPERMRAIAAVIGVVSVYALMIGYTYPALSFNLEARGFSPTVIGIQTALAGVGLAVASFFTPFIVARLGAWPTAVAGLILTVGSIALFGFFDSLFVWAILRLVISVGGAILFVVSETWINQLAPDRMRGRIVGIYTSLVSGMFALGPLLIGVIGYIGPAPYLIAAAMLALVGSPIVLLRGRAPTIEAVSARGIVLIVNVIPLLLLVVVCFGYFDAAMLGLWGVYALAEGVGTERAVLLLTALIIGNVVFQVPLGWLADRTSRRGLLIGCAFVGLAGAAGLHFMDLASPVVVPFLVIWGAFAFGTYTLAMTLVGEKLRGAQLVAANAGFSVMWGVGNLIGAAVTGPLMDTVGNAGFPVSIALAYALLFVATLVMVPVRVAVTQIRQAVPPGETR